ncbi:hypothetical protein ELH75_32050 (plasmid) [Rhizobium leguminosarum]|nr:hypothetical protein [Rhizobium leguminosarum]TAZ47128.1 hypothetical protein ELH75_32050 [Rhizobium leguminosarum]
MSFERAHGLLEEIRNLRAAMGAGVTPSPTMLHPLWLLQRLLVKEITRAERKIRRIKSILRLTAEHDGSDRSISLMT